MSDSVNSRWNPKLSLLTATMAAALCASGVHADTQIPSYTPIVTAPSIQTMAKNQVDPRSSEVPVGWPGSLADTAAKTDQAKKAQAQGTHTINFAVVDAANDTGLPYVLAPDLHPWPLRYMDQPPLNVLALDIPQEGNARLMLPGQAADMIDQARLVISRYFNDSTGIAAQYRGREEEAWESWLNQTESQVRKLSDDVWQNYEFNRESRRTVQDFRNRLDGQAKPQVQQMATAVQAAVNRIAPIINLMPTYELKLNSYKLMEQLRDGFSLYKGQVVAADVKLLHNLDDYLTNHPEMGRPLGTPPSPGHRAGTPAAAPVKPTAISLPRPVQAAPAPVQMSRNGSGGLLLAGGVMIALFAGFLYWRKKKAKTTETPKI